MVVVGMGVCRFIINNPNTSAAEGVVNRGGEHGVSNSKLNVATSISGSTTLMMHREITLRPYAYLALVKPTSNGVYRTGYIRWAGNDYNFAYNVGNWFNDDGNAVNYAECENGATHVLTLNYVLNEFQLVMGKIYSDYATFWNWENYQSITETNATYIPYDSSLLMYPFVEPNTNEPESVDYYAAFKPLPENIEIEIKWRRPIYYIPKPRPVE